jgi:hypothetical protein
MTSPAEPSAISLRRHRLLRRVGQLRKCNGGPLVDRLHASFETSAAAQRR